MPTVPSYWRDRLLAAGGVEGPRPALPAVAGLRLRPDCSEAEFTDQVLALAQSRGWRVIHLIPARTKDGWRTAVAGDGKGFPDVLALRGCRQVVAELKVPGGRVSREQEDWLSAFLAAEAETYTWWPADASEIQRVLT